VTTRFLRPKQVQQLLGIGHSKYYQDIKDGHLPRPVRLGLNSVAHPEDEIRAYQDKLRAERDQAGTAVQSDARA
jgi:predicted DNA-binding transcriptional regulator AlpA